MIKASIKLIPSASKYPRLVINRDTSRVWIVVSPTEGFCLYDCGQEIEYISAQIQDITFSDMPDKWQDFEGTITLTNS